MTLTKINTFLIFIFFSFMSLSLFAGPYDTNLLVNPGAEAGLTGWSFTSGGDGWAAGDWIPPHSGLNCFSTSYELCTKFQEVDLIAAGFTAEELDRGYNQVIWSEWLATHYFSGGDYYYRFRVLDGDHHLKSEIMIGDPEHLVEIADWSTPWFQISRNKIVMTPGMRYVTFECGGKDTRWWAGFYGTGFDDAVMSLHYDETLPVELTSFSGTLTSEMYVSLNWITQSETGISGYNILRNTSSDLSTAERVNASIIPATNTGEIHNYQFIDQDVTTNTQYSYWLQHVENDGTVSYHGPVNVSVGDGGSITPPPASTEISGLRTVYPNPFNPTAYVRYQVGRDDHITINVYNARGQFVRTLRNQWQPAGDYEVIWNGKDQVGRNCSTGLYFIRMTCSDTQTIAKAMMIK